MWESDEVVPRGELLNGVVGVQGLLCMAGDTVDVEVLDAAGEFILLNRAHFVFSDLACRSPVV